MFVHALVLIKQPFPKKTGFKKIYFFLAALLTSCLKVVASLNDLYHEGVCLAGDGGDGDKVKYAITEIRGDWKWQRDALSVHTV